MKKTNRVAFNIKKLSDEALIVKVQSIVVAMTNNVNFPAPLPELDALKTAAAAYEDALVAQQPGAKEDTVRKNEARAALEHAFRMLGTWVEVKSNNDLVTLLSSGFEVRKTPTPYGRLEKPGSLQIQLTSKPGSVKVTTAPVAGARIYFFQYALVPVSDESQWRTVGSTARTKIIDNLEVGKQYIFRVCGVGADPILVYSDEVMRFVA
jgi:hypothetical protein